MVNVNIMYAQQVEAELNQEFEELYQKYKEAVEELTECSEGEVVRVTSASFAQYLIVKLNKVCICNGLDLNTKQRFWIFIMSGEEAFDAYFDFDLDLFGEVKRFRGDEEELPHQISSASLAKYFVLKLGKSCIRTGLDNRTKQQFWLFMMTKNEANEALDKYNKEFGGVENFFN